MHQKIKILSIIFSMRGILAFAQTNLVPNWSFEQYDTCPSATSQIHFTSKWFQPNLAWGPGGSTDYYNQCAPSVADVPTNWIGYQNAKTGVAYAGVSPYYSANLPDGNREYLEVQLDSSLIAGRRYCVNFYASLANGAIIAIDAIGIYFSNDSILYNDFGGNYLSLTPQVSNTTGNIIDDTLNWTLISGEFIASGGERFLTMGNFNSGANTNTDTISINGAAYYYIDDVTIRLCDSIPEPSGDSIIYVPNAFSPNGDGENEIFFVQGDLDELHCSIFNRWGEPVTELNLPKQGWDGRVNGIECNSGVYFYFLIGKDMKGKEIVQKGNITLLR